MSTKDSEALEQQRQRRNRINRMKTGIIVTITVWMLVSLLAIILLTVQVARLSSHVKRLEKAGQTTVSQNIPDSENVQAADTESSGQETQKSAYDKVVTGIDSGDNMAKAGDAHKVYLTFDGGPDENTDKILDVLDKYGVKATFFVLGSNAEHNPDMVKKMYEQGHYIANHGYSHVYSLIYTSPETVLEEFNKTNEIVKNAIGIPEFNSHLFRFPGGYVGGKYADIKKQAKELLNQNDIYNIDWNCLSGDAETNNPTPEYIMKRIQETSHGKNSLIVLMHDAQAKKVTAEKLPEIIDYFASQGYEFKTFYDIFEK